MAKGKINVIRGKILIDHGKVQTCRCCGAGCEFCSGATPVTYEMVLSGITWCCVGGFRVVDASNLTNLTLTQYGGDDSCVWTGTTTVEHEEWSGLNCTGTLIHTDSANTEVRLEKLSTTSWRLVISCSGLATTFFKATITGQANNCTGELIFTPNEITGCSYLYMAYGGAVTVNVP